MKEETGGSTAAEGAGREQRTLETRKREDDYKNPHRLAVLAHGLKFNGLGGWLAPCLIGIQFPD